MLYPYLAEGFEIVNNDWYNCDLQKDDTYITLSAQDGKIVKITYDIIINETGIMYKRVSESIL